MSKRLWLALLTVAMMIGPIWIVAQGEPTATYTNRTLNVAIPYEASRAGTGQLSIDVLDPEDAVLAHVQRTVDIAAGKGRWEESLKLAKAPSVDELVWDRVRYRFTYAGSTDAAVEG